LLCAGLIGWRSLGIAGAGKKLGLYGFGAAAHIIAQVAQVAGALGVCLHTAGRCYHSGFARRLGATWAGASDEMPPEPLDAAIIFATIGDLVPLALKAVRKGGRVVCAGIHMKRHSKFPYRLLWEERQILSVANLTRQDGLIFWAWRGGRHRHPYHTLSAQPGQPALADLRAGRFEGAAVLVP